MVLGAGDRVDRYVLDELLGEGGQGSVWRASDPLSPTEARAVKLIDTRRASDTELERARREARALARLDHPSLCRCHGLFEDVHHHVLGVAMDFADGVSLAAAIDDPRMSLAMREQALLHVASALAHVHKHGLIHRDVKPLNVVVTDGFWSAPGEARHIKLVDFGIADIGHGKRLTKEGHVLGTPPYMAPEQIEPSHWGDERSPAIDVFSFGVMCWLVLADEHPTGLGPEAHLGDYAVAYRRAASEAWPPRLPLDCALTSALTRALGLHARDRWADCGAMLGAVASPPAPSRVSAPASTPASETRVHGAPRSPAVPKASGPASSLGAAALSSRAPTVEEHPVFPDSPSPRGRWKWALGLVLLVQAIGAGYWLWSSGDNEHAEPDESTQEDERDSDDETEEDGGPEVKDDDDPVPPPVEATASNKSRPPPPPWAPLPFSDGKCGKYANVPLPSVDYRARLSKKDHLDAKGQAFPESEAVLVKDRHNVDPSDEDEKSPGVDDTSTIKALTCRILWWQFRQEHVGDIPIKRMDATWIGRRILRGEPLVRVTYEGPQAAEVSILASGCSDLDANVRWLTRSSTAVPKRQAWIDYLQAMRKREKCDKALEELNKLYEKY